MDPLGSSHVNKTAVAKINGNKISNLPRAFFHARERTARNASSISPE
jgi:hypothetical protein